MWVITVQQLPKNLFQQGNEFHFTIFLVQWASFECVNSKKKNPFYQWISFELCTTSWRSLSSHLFIAPCSPLVALALVRSLSFHTIHQMFILMNSLIFVDMKVLFNQMIDLRPHEIIFPTLVVVCLPARLWVCVSSSLSTLMSCVLSCNECSSKDSAPKILSDKKPKNVIHDLL